MFDIQYILLQKGTVLVHDDNNHVNILKDHDVLIEGNKISKIGQDLAVPSHAAGGARLIDCRGKIVSPGFVDTHHHLWQSQLKGRHGDESFVEYMISGNLQSYNYDQDDIFWGQLADCLESLDAGVTTVVDHAHMSYSPGHVTEAIRATASSGLRSFFCYTAMKRIKTWSSSQLEFEDEPLPEWWHTTLDSLATMQPFGDGQVYLGLAFDMFSLPRDTVVGLWEKCRRLGVKLMTTHYVAGAMTNSVKLLSEYGLLKNDVLFSHATQISETDAKTLAEHDVFISSTPDTELQMGLGESVAFRKDITCNASFGIDCHSNNSSDILTQARLGMQHARGIANTQALANGDYATVQIKLEEAFNLGTIQGARAVHMSAQIGSLAEGKLADIVVFDARSSPAMVCAAEQNPLAAILLHGSVRDIDVVIVDGVLRKQDKRLCDVSVLDEANGKAAVGLMEWDQVAAKLLESRARINERGRSQSQEAAMQSLHKVF